jgi:hypothetical protein
MEGLQTASGESVKVEPARSEADFAAALAKPMAAIPDVPDAPSKDEKAARRTARSPRTSKAAQGPKEGLKEAPEAIKKESEYLPEAEGLVTSLWMVTAALPPTQAYAVVVHGNSDALAAGLAKGAPHNRTIRKALSQGGDGAWMLQLGSVGLSMGIQAYQLMSDPKLREECRELTKNQLREYLKSQGIAVPETGVGDERTDNAQPTGVSGQ